MSHTKLESLKSFLKENKNKNKISGTTLLVFKQKYQQL